MENEDKLEQMLERIFEKLDQINTIEADELPNIDLYMDQVTTFMDSHLRKSLRNPEADKVLTKTMINNYAKNDLIPPPIKKKYTREHLFELLFIFYFKSFLSINDIQTILQPLTESFFGKGREKDGFGVEDIYNELLEMGHGARKKLKGEMLGYCEKVKSIYPEAPDSEREYLQKFAYICALGYDVFLKRTIIEQMIDEMASADRAQEQDKKE